jgi:hypothetical protein
MLVLASWNILRQFGIFFVNLVHFVIHNLKYFFQFWPGVPKNTYVENPFKKLPSRQEVEIDHQE